jgi:hypothetical protein
MLDEQARQFILDVKAGVSDAVLQKKYNLSGRKFVIAKASAKDYLAKLKQQTAKPTRMIEGKQFLSDVKAALDDEALMRKYGLTSRQLQQLFRELISAGLATPLQLSNRLSITKSQVTEAFVEVGKAIEELD